MGYEVEHSEGEWRAILTPERYHIMRQAGTEPAFDNEYWDNHEDGAYRCGACGAVLFDSRDKFDSGTGWPSFTRTVDQRAVDTASDASLGVVRTEVLCGRCGGHLGHVFEDGPPPTGLRYCMNSGAMDFVRRESGP